MHPPIRPASRILTERLVLRCYQPADAPLLRAAIVASADHLRPWMPWAAREPKHEATIARRLRRFRGRFDLGKDFIYGLFDRDERRVLGGSGLHRSIGAGAREIGYWLHADCTGRGYATEAAAALTRVGFEHEALTRIEIHCDPRNGPSTGVPMRLGFVLQTTVRDRVPGPRGPRRDTMIWRLDAGTYAASPATSAKIRAFDATGRRVL
ncbi:MAG: GNAT family N-acetyltransferase [Planctomycetota bacterium]|nr:GNAT family N-acetyltransferase [Planctomycetota bacterium]